MVLFTELHHSLGRHELHALHGFYKFLGVGASNPISFCGISSDIPFYRIDLVSLTAFSVPMLDNIAFDALPTVPDPVPVPSYRHTIYKKSSWLVSGVRHRDKALVTYNAGSIFRHDFS